MICATVALPLVWVLIVLMFVCRIIHLGPPDDVESYIEETGRAEKDGLPAHATLLVNRKQ